MNNLSEYIYIIGKGRFVKIIVLFALCLSLVAGIYYYMMPVQKETLKSIESVKRDNMRLQSEIAQMPLLLEQYKNAEKRYENLLEKDFISDQDRIMARRLIDGLREMSNLLTVQYDITPINFEEDSRTSLLSHQVGRSRINMTFEASIDLEAYAFVQLMEKYFQGALLLKSLNLTKANEVNEGNLIRIGKGEPVPFIKGSAVFDWYTMIKKEETEQSPQL